MATLEEIRALVAAVGPANADIEGVLERAEDDWLLRYPDLDVALEFELSSQRLVLSAELDEPRSETRLEIFTTLLTYSLLWRETGGVYVGLTDSGRPVLLLPLSAAEITPDRLAGTVENFRTKARLLNTYIARGEAPPVAAFDSWMLGSIRV